MSHRPAASFRAAVPPAVCARCGGVRVATTPAPAPRTVASQFTAAERALIASHIEADARARYAATLTIPPAPSLDARVLALRGKQTAAPVVRSGGNQHTVPAPPSLVDKVMALRRQAAGGR